MRERDALGPRRGAARELEERHVVEADLLGLERLGRLADALDGDDLLERGTGRLHGAEQALDLGGRHEDPGAALGDDVPRVVEVGLELPERHRRVDGRGDDPGADGAEEAEDEVVVVREDERDPVALAEAERLEGSAEAGAHALDGGEGERGLARVHDERVVRAAWGRPGAEARDARLGDEAEAASRLGLGGVFDGLGDGAGRHGEGCAVVERGGKASDGVLYQSSGVGPTPKPRP